MFYIKYMLKRRTVSAGFFLQSGTIKYMKEVDNNKTPQKVHNETRKRKRNSGEHKEISKKLKDIDDILPSYGDDKLLDDFKDQAQIGLSKSCNISHISIPPNFVEGTADNKGDCFFDAITQALTIHLTESSEKIENNLKQDVNSITINGNSNTTFNIGKFSTISGIQDDYILSSDDLTQQEHKVQHSIIDINTVTKEELGTQYNVPADGNQIISISQNHTQSSENVIMDTDSTSQESVHSESDSDYTHLLSSSDYLDSNSDQRSQIQTRARAYTQSLTQQDQEKDIDKILEAYRRDKFNISVEVAHDGSDKNTLDHYKITDIVINRTSKHNNNHTVPLSFFSYSLKYSLKGQSVSNVKAIIDHKYINQFHNGNDYWHTLLGETSKCTCQESIKVFLQEKIVPYIVYRWNTRIMSVFKEKRLPSEYGKEGSKIKKFIKKIFSESKKEPENILNGDDNLTEIKNKIQDLLNEFLQCIDLPKDLKGIAIILHDARELFYVLLFSIEKSTNNSNIYDDSSDHFTKKYEQLRNTIRQES